MNPPHVNDPSYTPPGHTPPQTPLFNLLFLEPECSSPPLANILICMCKWKCAELLPLRTFSFACTNENMLPSSLAHLFICMCKWKCDELLISLCTFSFVCANENVPLSSSSSHLFVVIFSVSFTYYCRRILIINGSWFWSSLRFSISLRSSFSTGSTGEGLNIPRWNDEGVLDHQRRPWNHHLPLSVVSRPARCTQYFHRPLPLASRGVTGHKLPKLSGFETFVNISHS